MIRKLILIALLAGAFMFPMNMSSMYVTLHRQCAPLPPEEPEDPENPHRTPVLIICSVTESGIDIPGVDKSELLSYEIYDADGNPVAAFADETEFTDCLFSLSGTFEIRLITHDYTLSGLIEL